ncbi:MAG: hypothetical protein O3B01_20255 [Planctomycetota bacterium]|nr:hypothetical protein [Planctomycetota bacterium]MDA1140905.1 hypothetical protein [Planctomycetota bacterium]
MAHWLLLRVEDSDVASVFLREPSMVEEDLVVRRSNKSGCRCAGSPPVEPTVLEGWGFFGVEREGEQEKKAEGKREDASWQLAGPERAH